MFKPSNIEFQNDEISVARATLIAEGERLLSEVVLEQEGENILRRLEELDGLAEKFANQPASHSHKIVDEVKATVASFTREEAEKVAKALSIRELITTAISGGEFVQSTGNLSEPEVLSFGAFCENGLGSDILARSFEKLKADGFDSKGIGELLKSIEVTSVLTPHPTWADRYESLKKTQEICLLLQKAEFLDQKIKAALTLLWQIEWHRDCEITPAHEAERAFFFLKETVYKAVELFYRQFCKAKSETGLESGNDYTCPKINFGSLICSDRVGNPAVTPQLTRDFMQLLRDEILNLYLGEIDFLIRELTPSVKVISVSKALKSSINSDLKQPLLNDSSLYSSENFNLHRFEGLFPTRLNDFSSLSTEGAFKRSTDQLYRKKLIIIAERLKRTLNPEPGGYTSPDQFIEDLRLIDESLCENKAASVAELWVKPLIYKVESFGFHFVKTEVKQNSRRIRDAVEELLFQTGVAPGFRKMSEEQKVKVLRDEVLSSRPLTNQFSVLAPETAQIIEEIGVIKWASENISAGSGTDYVFTDCSAFSDLLSALLLAKEAGLIRAEEGRIADSRLDIVPQFEPSVNPEKAKEVLREMFDSRLYRRHLRLRGKKVKLLLDYTEAAKHSGAVASGVQMVQLQKALTDLCNEFKFEPIFYHGKGGGFTGDIFGSGNGIAGGYKGDILGSGNGVTGSVSENVISFGIGSTGSWELGGGVGLEAGNAGRNANRFSANMIYDAITATPYKSLFGRVKFTEPGETLAAKYAFPETAAGSLAGLVAAVLLKTAETSSVALDKATDATSPKSKKGSKVRKTSEATEASKTTEATEASKTSEATETSKTTEATEIAEIPEVEREPDETAPPANLSYTSQSLSSTEINLLRTIAGYAEEKYRSLVETQGFFDYFRRLTPVDLIEKLESSQTDTSGSSPKSDSSAGFVAPGVGIFGKDTSAIRSVPWAFAWGLQQLNISQWFGYGTAVEETILHEHATEADLIRLYNGNQIFKNTTNQLEIALFKTDLRMAKEFTTSQGVPGAAKIYKLIKEEFDKSVSAVLLLTGDKFLLSRNPQLQRNLLTANRYLVPLSFIRQKFWEEWRKNGSPANDPLLHLLRLTVKPAVGKS
ncbi:MAG: phosphoenolpyruvate carboxylase [Ignavibacteriales bacterium]|jgi:Phosphoenolpyruvate carboxylase|nr:MAG: phosphoenolpyruvate carboxylase [Ignavibacteriaceae bacterium]MBW7873725.1 phosphoenolpyruvate carboxylase [Ignavibacteria bacterium]MCZ2143950.1 phosphoenolpyruvate carboxylase [Ignavibacteriales bacterium]OQY71254.1 MAG: hypothetical protein B6D45_10290 [Ignavibacteriales bacterium UTCHB3]MBV6444626.1 Phosphoenolpyruvate carboxylase [Ignavibacteriaceae bacterium]